MHESSTHGEVTTEMWAGFLTAKVRPLGLEELRRFTGKRILVTGGGGYLGSALARALTALPLEHLVLLDQAEYGLYELDQDLRKRPQRSKLSMIVGRVEDRVLLRQVFAEHAPEVIFHAAALKHVPLMESNAVAAAETNALGTEVLVDLAARAKAESFVLLSTDKAADPISVMGATKRVAEQIVLRAHEFAEGFISVRLCNVLGSTGSVAPLFVRQIATGGPVTLTHPEATRYFLTRADAVSSLLRAAVTPSQEGILVPLLGAPNRVKDLARFLMASAGPSQRTVEIVHTGLRIGDKLHEQLISRAEFRESSPDPQMLGVRSNFDREQLQRALAALRQAVANRDVTGVLQAIRLAVPEYVQQSAANSVAGE